MTTTDSEPAAWDWHWGRVGRSEQVTTGDWQVARGASLLGSGALAAGDGEGRDHHAAAARAALERETDTEDRDLVAGQLASVPDVAGGG